MNETVTPADLLMVRAGLYELLAVGFSYPSDAQQERLMMLAADLVPWLALTLPDWRERLQALQQSGAGTDGSALEADFNRLFSGSMEAVPFETAYERDIFRKQHALADIAGFYRAYGFCLPEGTRWQSDHVGVEMEFCAIVLQRMARAVAEGWEEQAAICLETLRSFLLDHLGRWSDALAQDLIGATALPYYQQLARLTREWVALEVGALGLEPDRLSARVTYADDAALPNCGGCTGCGPAGPVGPVGSCPRP